MEILSRGSDRKITGECPVCDATLKIARQDLFFKSSLFGLFQTAYITCPVCTNDIEISTEALENLIDF